MIELFVAGGSHKRRRAMIRNRHHAEVEQCVRDMSHAQQRGETVGGSLEAELAVACRRAVLADLRSVCGRAWLAVTVPAVRFAWHHLAAVRRSGRR